MGVVALACPFVWFLFFPTVFFSARLVGLRGGLASTVLSVVMVWYFFIPPQLSFALEKSANVYSMGLFLVMGYLISNAQERLALAQKNSENRFQATFEQAAVGIALVAQDGRWLRVNQKLCDIVGYSHAELLACTFQDITHPTTWAPTLMRCGGCSPGRSTLMRWKNVTCARTGA